MNKKTMLLTSLVSVTAFGAFFASFFANQNYSYANATDTTVPHQIVFGEGDSINTLWALGKEGVEFTKSNATRSGDLFVMTAYAGGDMYTSQNYGNFLYCETNGTSELNPSSYFEVDFTIYNIASFTSVILHGTFYTNRKKTTVVNTMLVDTTYDEANHKVTGKAFPFKGYLTGIELNYTCVA